MATLLAGAGAAAAGTAAAGATAATATTAATIGTTALNILSGVATVAGILGTLSAADSEANALNASAIMTDLEAGQQQVQSTQRQTEMKRELLRVLGENDVTIAAAGIDLTGGVADSSRAQAKEAATRELSIERSDDELRRALLKTRSSGLRARAGEAKSAGLFKAFGQAASLGADLFERG